MEDSTRLLTLSFAMFVGSFGFGAVPLVFSLSEGSLHRISIVGAGLLVGTALAVIIPEGVHALYEQHKEILKHDHFGILEKTAAPVGVSKKLLHSNEGDSHSHEHTDTEIELHTLIGISLCLGFIFMLLVDQLSAGHSHGPETDNSRRATKSLTATLGLVVHAAADGVALGAAATMSRTDVEMIVFLAIMLHKAPAAFGLTTFLLHESFDRNRIRRHLLTFSLAAPVAAVLTFYGLSQGSKEALSSINATGITMLFSAGTFLYVATVHILPEMKTRSKTQSVEEASCSENEQIHSDKFSRSDLCLLILGIIMPLIFGAFHKH